MSRAILVFQVLSYRHFLGLDDDSCDSGVLCDHSHSSECGEDKHLNVNFSKARMENNQRINIVLYFICLGVMFDLAQFLQLISITSLKPRALHKLSEVTHSLQIS